MRFANNKRMLFIFCLVSINISCGVADKISKKNTKSDEKPSTVPSKDPASLPLPEDGKILQLSDLEVPAGYKVKSIPWDDLIKSLNSNSSFYNHRPVGAPPAGESPDDCIKSVNDAIWVANKVSARSYKSVDVSDCIKKSWSAFTFSRFTAVMKSYSYYTCTGGDISAINNKKLSDGVTFDCPQLSRRTEFVFEIEGDGISNNDGTRMIMKISDITYYGTKSLGGCTVSSVNPNEAKNDDCIELNRHLFSAETSMRGELIGETKEYDLEKLSFKGIIDDNSSDTNIWHKAGTITLDKNDWQGTVNYSGSMQAPTFTLKNTTTDEVKTGNLTATPSTGLR